MSRESIMENILAPVIGNILDVSSVVMNSPEYMVGKIGDDEKASFIKIGKGAENYLYKKLSLKPATSKEVYKKSEDIWRQLRDLQFSLIETDKENPNYFSLDKETLLYITNYRGVLIDMYDARTGSGVLEFKDLLEKFKLTLTTDKTRQMLKEEKDDTFKMVITKNRGADNIDYVSCVILEVNTIKSSYRIYTGIYLQQTMIVYPSLTEYYSCNSYVDMILNVNLEDVLNYAEENGEELYKDYNYMMDNDTEISARELISLIKKAGFKLEMKDDADIAELEELKKDVEGNQKIQDFFNTFKFTTGETAHDILTLSELKKIFKYNKLTTMDVLNIFSKAYIDQNIPCPKINVDLLMSITYNMFYKMGDKIKTNEIKTQIN